MANKSNIRKPPKDVQPRNKLWIRIKHAQKSWLLTQRGINHPRITENQIKGSHKYHACFTGDGAWGNGANSIVMHDKTKCELTTETAPMMSTLVPFVSRA